MTQYGSQLVGRDVPSVDRIPGSSPGHTAKINGTPGDGLSGGHEVADVIQGLPLTRRYQRTGQMLIRPLLFTDNPAFDLAKLFYAQYPDLNFAEDLLDYMRTGFVCSRPNLFVMAKVINYQSEVMWFCRIAIGNLVELLLAMPFYMERIAFCRNNRATSMRICSTKRLCELAKRNARLKGKKYNELCEQRV